MAAARGYQTSVRVGHCLRPTYEARRGGRLIPWLPTLSCPKRWPGVMVIPRIPVSMRRRPAVSARRCTGGHVYRAGVRHPRRQHFFAVAISHVKAQCCFLLCEFSAILEYQVQQPQAHVDSEQQGRSGVGYRFLVATAAHRASRRRRICPRRAGPGDNTRQASHGKWPVA
jgi:hypothetical protein